MFTKLPSGLWRIYMHCAHNTASRPEFLSRGPCSASRRAAKTCAEVRAARVRQCLWQTMSAHGSPRANPKPPFRRTQRRRRRPDCVVDSVDVIELHEERAVAERLDSTLNVAAYENTDPTAFFFFPLAPSLHSPFGLFLFR